MTDNSIKRKIKDAFKQQTLFVKSVASNGEIQLKQIIDVLKHYVPYKNIHKIVLENLQEVIVTEDHSIYVYDEMKSIVKVKPSDFPQEILIEKDNEIVLEKVLQNDIVKSKEYMYDLSVLDNQNFILQSKILVSNSFASPSSDATIAGFTNCRGYRWPDEQLANHLMQAMNYINLYAPISCFDICQLPCLLEDLVLQEAMIYAFYDMASLWINEEFNYSLNGINLDINRSEKYLNMASQLQQRVDALLERSKLPLMRSMKGLRQSPYTFSRGAALGPMTSGLSLNRFVR